MFESALADVKVVDLTHYIAGPYCTKLLADYGADVIKVERPDGGDGARQLGPFLNDEPHPEKSGLFAYLNTTKRGITLNLKAETGRAILLRLIKDADILVESYAPRVMSGLGLSYETLKEINPRLVMVSISNFGQTGPYRDFKASELVHNAMGTEMHSRGLAEREPVKMGGNAVQYQAGTMAAVAANTALWGAEVIRVESTRRLPPTTRGRQARPSREAAKLAPVQFTYVDDEPGARPWNRCAMFNYAGRNKLGCTMDLMKPKGKDLFKQLIAKSDVFIENNGGGAVEKLGLGYSVLKEVNPQLIMISLPAYGNFGPYKAFGGFGVHQEATSGHLWLLGYPDLGPETNPATFHPDACAGTHATLAVLLAMRHRRRTGKGQFVDLAQAETSLCHQADAVLDYTLNGRVRTKTGNRHSSAAPCGVYPCQGEDEWVAITVFGDEDWAGFCRAVGNPELTGDARFSTALSRWNNQDGLDRLVESWTRERSNYEIMYALQKEGVAAGPVISNKDALDDPHLLDREQFEAVYQEECGTHLTPSFLWRAKNTPNKIRLPAVRMGEHNGYVYKDLIGVSEEEYVQLEKEGHIGMDFAPHVR